MSEQRDKIAVLISHWIDHNEGHRQSYLEWRDKLADQDLPETLAALQTIADLTTEANAALERAAVELGTSGAAGELGASDPEGRDAAGHDHTHAEAGHHGHGHGHGDHHYGHEHTHGDEGHHSH